MTPILEDTVEPYELVVFYEGGLFTIYVVDVEHQAWRSALHRSLWEPVFGIDIQDRIDILDYAEKMAVEMDHQRYGIKEGELE